MKMALLIAILIVIKMPFFYFYKGEIDQLEEGFNARQFNSVFIGSSRTRTSIIPAYFDSTTDGKTLSYNYGILGSFGHNNLNFAEEIIRDKPSVKFLFIELGSMSEERVAMTEELWESFTFSAYWYRAKAMPHNEISGFHDRLAVRFFTPNFTKRNRDFNVDLRTALAGRELVNPAKVTKQALRETRSLNLRVETENIPIENSDDWDRIVGIIDLAESKNIQIRFFIPPRLGTESEVRAISSVYRKLENKNKLHTDHSGADIYTPETSLDAIHLNRRGAINFTKSFAEEFENRQMP